jgi:hypothetical protein
MALQNARQKLADLKGPLELQELQQRIKQMGASQFKGTTELPGGGLGAITVDPNTGQPSMKPLVAPLITPEAAREHITKGRTSLPANEQYYADSLLSELTNLKADPSKVIDKWEQYLSRRTDRPLAGDEPLGTRVPQLNAALNARYQVMNPHKDLPAYFTLLPSATQKDFDNIDKILQATESAAGKDQPVQLSGDALEAVTDVFLRTGQLPSLGLGGVGVREKVFNRAGEILAGKGKPSSNIGDPIVAAKAAFTSLQASLTQLQRQRAAVGAFENTALKNLEMFERTAQGVVDKGSPWINKPLREVERQGLGNADLAAFNAARQVAMTEISRVISNPNLTGVLSDSARGEAGALIGPDATLKQIYSAADILKQDMANRRQSLDEEITNVRGQLTPQRGGPPPTTATPPPGAPVVSLQDFLRGQ